MMSVPKTKIDMIQSPFKHLITTVKKKILQVDCKFYQEDYDDDSSYRDTQPRQPQRHLASSLRLNNQNCNIADDTMTELVWTNLKEVQIEIRTKISQNSPFYVNRFRLGLISKPLSTHGFCSTTEKDGFTYERELRTTLFGIRLHAPTSSDSTTQQILDYGIPIGSTNGFL